MEKFCILQDRVFQGRSVREGQGTSGDILASGSYHPNQGRLEPMLEMLQYPVRNVTISC